MLQGLLVNFAHVNSPNNENKILVSILSFQFQIALGKMSVWISYLVSQKLNESMISYLLWTVSRKWPFLLCFKTSDASRIAMIYFDEVVRLHSCPKQLSQTWMLSSRVTFRKPCGIKWEINFSFLLSFTYKPMDKLK